MASLLSVCAAPLLGILAALAPAAALADTSPGGASASTCQGHPLVQYVLGPKVNVDRLYPLIQTASTSAYDASMAVAASIQLYLQSSLTRDRITDVCGLKVTPLGPQGYQVSFQSAQPQAAQYGAVQQAWLRRGMRALQGVQACQNSTTPACWEPQGAGLACVGPWQFYLPLGLPMLAQKMVMLLHYPPYSAMQQSDYLNNATLKRWQRLLVSVGVNPPDWTLYTTTVDIFPIAAPGSGQSGCFTTSNASLFFGAQGSGYIPIHLQALVTPPTLASTSGTLPVVVFGSEAIGYWNASYPHNPTGVLKAGSVVLDATQPQRRTPYTGANHPIAAVYQSCESKPGITTMVGQDLASACFAKAMGDQPDADPLSVQAQCQAAYLNPPLAPTAARQVCVNAVIDKSPQFAPWSPAQAQAWCAAHQDQACPLPSYYGK
ncbi:MAG: hypothetical protein ACT4NV_06530 [Rhodoferax sp.]